MTHERKKMYGGTMAFVHVASVYFDIRFEVTF